MYEMKYLKENDMPYFRKLAEEGKAIIFEFSDRALFNVDADRFREPTGEIARSDLEEILQNLGPVLEERSKEGQRLNQEIREMEELLEKEPEAVREVPAGAAEQMKKMLEELILSCMHGIGADR